MNIHDLSLQDITDRLYPMKQHLYDNYRNLCDIYSQDIYNLRIMKNISLGIQGYKYDDLRQPIVLFSNAQYIGHIYQIGRNMNSNKASFIGIRESLTNTLNKILKPNNSISSIGFLLLDACRQYVMKSQPHIKMLELSAPIGPMKYIATKYGFEDGESMGINGLPKVFIPGYTLVIL